MTTPACGGWGRAWPGTSPRWWSGWRVGGITGLARAARWGRQSRWRWSDSSWCAGQGRGVFVLVSLTEPAVAAAALLLLRPYPWAWVAAASLVGLRAAMRFIRPGARHVRGPRWAETGLQSPQEEPATSLLIEAVWRRTSPKAADAELRQALDVARRNRVEGCLARAYPAQLADVLEEARAADELFALHVGQVTGCLRHAGIPAVLIPVGTPGDHIGASIEMVIPSGTGARR